jgi:hypothetical protein
MVAPGLLQNPEVRRWLNGIEPAWTILEFDSLNALHDEPSASNRAIRLEPNLAEAEMSGSAIVANALILLRRAADTDGLKLTATGNLSRAVVEEMCGSWNGQGMTRTTVRSAQGHQRARLPAAAFHSRPDPSREALPNVSRKAGDDAFG